MPAAQQPLWVVGDAIVDVTIPDGGPRRLRLGGACHAARALWAANLPYRLAYASPDYLVGAVERFCGVHQALRAERVGTVDGAPNVLVITSPTEAGPQGYEFLLREERHVEIAADALAVLANSDVLVLADATSLAVLSALPETTRVHLDAAVDPGRAREALGRQLNTYMTSTSDDVLREFGSVAQLAEATIGSAAARLLLKEGRGGARLVDNHGEVAVAAQLRPIVHSVGVGDAFDALWLSLRVTMDDRSALAYAAACAAVYASTTDPDELRAAMRATLAIPPEEIVAMAGVRVPVEVRGEVSIYVAAPDFTWVDRRPIDALAEALSYHGFSPRLPVREHGELPADASVPQREAVVAADMAMLDACQLMVAVLIFDDPGTLVELGIAHERGMPTIVYDPYGRAANPFVRDLPLLCSSSLDEIVDAVFVQVSRAQ